MVKRIVEIEEKELEKLKGFVDYRLREDFEKEVFGKFIYIPSMNIYVSKELHEIRGNHHEVSKLLHSRKEKLLSLAEFREFLIYARDNLPEIYNSAISPNAGNSLEAERLDAEISWDGKSFYLSYHAFEDNGEVSRKKEALDETTLIKSKFFGLSPFGISLEDYLKEGSTIQGFPQHGLKKGDLRYVPPQKKRISVGAFYRGKDMMQLSFDENPQLSPSYMKLRIVKKEL